MRLQHLQYLLTKIQYHDIYRTHLLNMCNIDRSGLNLNIFESRIVDHAINIDLVNFVI